jgi:hypothetical protein
MCTNGPSGRTCGSCPSGYSGSGEGGCVALPCTSNPCQHGAACANLPGAPADYQCACPPGINGKNCDIVFTDITGVFSGTCGLRSDGKVACWNETDLVTDPPTGTFSAIVGGPTSQLCGLDASNVAHCFGTDYNDARNTPSTPFTAVSVGASGGCGALLGGAGIGCWNPSLTYTVPATGTYTAVSVGTHHTCAVASAQTLGCWGQTGVPSIDFGQTIPPGGTFLDVSSGTYGSCARRTDSTVACWGAGGDQLPLVAPSGTFSVIDYRSTYGCGVKTDGTLACWGGGPFGIPLTLPSGSFRDIATNAQHACAIRTDDSVACFGFFADNSPIPTGQP